MKEQTNKNAFTLAEVVITLIIIGVVSAITVPMLSNDVNDKKWNVGRQKAQATIGEAFKLATVNGYVTPDYANMNAVYDMNGKKGPNQIGKDIGFIGSFYNGFGVKVAAILPYKEMSFNNSLPGNGSDYWLRALKYCNELHDNDWKMANIEELSLVYLNFNLLGCSFDYFLSSTPFSKNFAWGIYADVYNSGGWAPIIHNRGGAKFYCVRTNVLK